MASNLNLGYMDSCPMNIATKWSIVVNDEVASEDGSGIASVRCQEDLSYLLVCPCSVQWMLERDFLTLVSKADEQGFLCPGPLLGR
jgi:hypothetical protein